MEGRRKRGLSCSPLSAWSSYRIVCFRRSLSSHCRSPSLLFFLSSSLPLSLLLFSSIPITWGVCTPQHNEVNSSPQPDSSDQAPFLSHFFSEELRDHLPSFSSSAFFFGGEKGGGGGADARYYPLSFSLTWISISALAWFFISQLPVHHVPLCLLPSSIRRNIYRQIDEAEKDIHRASVSEREKSRKLETASLTEGSPQRGEKERREELKREEEEEEEKELQTRARTTSQAFLIAVRNRSLGFIHAVLISSLALACVAVDPHLTRDRMDGNSPLFTVMGEVSLLSLFFFSLLSFSSLFLSSVLLL